MTESHADKPGTTRPGLADLHRVRLSPRHEQMLARKRPTCGGSAGWVRRKIREATDLCAMAELGPRLRVQHLDLDVGITAVLRLVMPVAHRADRSGDVTLADWVGLALHYPECAVCHPQPGCSFVEIVHPKTVFHPNISPLPPYFLCLGTSMPAGIPCKELVLMAYAALSFQTVMLDPREGVMHVEAARYFAENQDRLPLTSEPFVPQP